MNEQTALKFYTDTHIAKAVAVQLRNQGVDIVRCEEVGLAKASDSDHLEYACNTGRAMISRDADFLTLHAEYLEQGKSHYGIFFVLDHLQGKGAVGVIVRYLLEYYQLVAGGAASVEDDIANQVIYIS